MHQTVMHHVCRLKIPQINAPCMVLNETCLNTKSSMALAERAHVAGFFTNLIVATNVHFLVGHCFIIAKFVFCSQR